MSSVVDKFLRYVKIDTQSWSPSDTFPSTEKQKDLGRLLTKELQEMGAVNVLVSMAGDGAILVTEDKEVHKQLPPKGKVVNSVGAGDSMVAGFTAGYLNTGDYLRALELGTAAGSATAFVSWLATRDEITEKLEKPVSVYGL